MVESNDNTYGRCNNSVATFCTSTGTPGVRDKDRNSRMQYFIKRDNSTQYQIAFYIYSNYSAGLCSQRDFDQTKWSQRTVDKKCLFCTQEIKDAVDIDGIFYVPPVNDLCNCQVTFEDFNQPGIAYRIVNGNPSTDIFDCNP